MSDEPQPVDQPTSADEPPDASDVAADGDVAGAAEWNPEGLDLARSVVGGLVKAPRGPAGMRRGRGQRTPSASSPDRSGISRVGGISGGGELSGAHPDDRDPQSLDSTIDRLVADRGWNTDVAVAGALARWDQIVGPDIAEHCRPERYADAILTVRADSTAWATQVRLLAPTLVKRLNEDLGDGTVVRVNVLGPTAPDWRKGGVGTRDGRGPRDTYG